MLRDYTPEVGIDLHEGDSEDLPILSSRHLNVFAGAVQRGEERPRRGLAVQRRRGVGLVARPVQQRRRQPRGHPPQHVSGSRASSACWPRTAPPAGPPGRRRGRSSRTATASRTGASGRSSSVLEYYWQRRATIHQAVEDSIAFNKANVGRVVLRGSYPWTDFPGLAGTEGLPDTDAPLASRIIDPPPCGYFITEAQYSGPIGGPTMAGPPRGARRRAGHAAGGSHHPARPEAARADPDDVRHGVGDAVADRAGPAADRVPAHHGGGAELLEDAARGQVRRATRSRSGTSRRRSTSRSTGRSPRPSPTAPLRATCRGSRPRPRPGRCPRPAGAERRGDASRPRDQRQHHRHRAPLPRVATTRVRR